MGASTGPTAADRAGDQALRLGHGWIGPEHVLLALVAEPSAASEALEELGVTRELVERSARTVSDPPGSPYVPGRGLSPNPAWYRLTGLAEGLALAGGHRRPGPEHFLLAMVYDEQEVAPLLHRVGSTQEALLEALTRRGVRVPEADPPPYRPWRGHRRVDVTEAELQPVIDVLTAQHPPGSEWRWGFNWYPGDERPRRAWVGGEEGIDFEAALATARDRAGA